MFTLKIYGRGEWLAKDQKVNSIVKGLGPDYASTKDKNFLPRYRASCFCQAIQYEACADPVDAKFCHCRACQTLHGAPMQWAAIFHKRDIRIVKGLDTLKFFNSEFLLPERILPCKISCSVCGTPIADEGRKMWLAFPSLFSFENYESVPEKFKPTCHIFYGLRVVDVDDELPKWSGHKNKSRLL